MKSTSMQEQELASLTTHLWYIWLPKIKVDIDDDHWNGSIISMYLLWYLLFYIAWYKFIFHFGLNFDVYFVVYSAR